MSLPAWVLNLKAKEEQDNRTQPWKEAHEKDVADRNPRSHINEGVDLFENTPIAPTLVDATKGKKQTKPQSPCDGGDDDDDDDDEPAGGYGGTPSG